MPQWLTRFWTEERGQNVTEYALLLMLVCLTAISTVSGMAAEVNNICSNASTHMSISTSYPSFRGSRSVLSTDSSTNVNSRLSVGVKPERFQ